MTEALEGRIKLTEAEDVSTLTALSLTVTTEKLPANILSYVHCEQASAPYYLHTFAKVTTVSGCICRFIHFS